MRCDTSCVLGLVGCQAPKSPRLCEHAQAGHEGYIKAIREMTAAAIERQAVARSSLHPQSGSCAGGCQLGLRHCLGQAFPHVCEGVTNGDAKSKALALQAAEAGVIYSARTSLASSPLGIGDSKIGSTRAFLSGGIGDFLVFESHLPERTRRTLTAVYHAGRGWQTTKELLEACAAGFPALEGHEVFFNGKDEWHTLPQAVAGLGRPELLGRVEDWNVFREFPRIASGELSFSGSSFLKQTIADVSRFGLPERFVAVHPASVNQQRDDRDFTDADWAWLLGHLERKNVAGVILGTGDAPRPHDDRLIDLTGQTSYPEAVEVLKAASSFVGTASSLSVLAAQLFTPLNLIIRGPGRHVRDHRRIYYAPHREVFFLRPTLTYDTLHSYTFRRLDDDLDRAVEREIAVQSRLPRTDKPVRWIFVFGCWGDLICQLGYARHIRESTGERVAIAVYWHDDAEGLEAFLAAQVDLADCRVIRPKHRLEYLSLHSRWLADGRHLAPKETWLPEILEGTGIPLEQVDFLPLLTADSLDSPLHRFRGVDLPASSREWAEDLVEELRAEHRGKKLVVVHPFSTNSTRLDDHWPHWRDAVAWLGEQPDLLPILTGLGVPEDWDTPPGVVDLAGETPSQCDHWALAELADGLITTTNSLALFAIVADRPSVVVTNRAMTDRRFYFRRWLEGGSNRIVEFGEDLEAFKAAVREKAAEFGRPASAPPYRAPAYNRAYFDRYVGYEGTAIAAAINDARVELVRRHAPSDAAVLDVGIGSGEFLREWTDAGGKGYGTDVNPIARQWLEESGQWVDPYTSLPDDVGCVTTWDVLEHFESPGELLGRLPEGCVLCGSIPIFPDLTAEAIKASKHYRPDEHLVYFSEKGLTWYLADLGFVLLETNDAETRAGRESILSFAFRKDWAAVKAWKAANAPPLTLEEKRASLTDDQRQAIEHCEHRKQRPSNCCSGVEDYCGAGEFGGRAILRTTQCVECVADGLEHAPRPKLHWLVAIGAWGDVLVQLGYARHLYESTRRKVGLICYTFDERIGDFLRCQHWLADVRVIVPPDRATYFALHHAWISRAPKLAPPEEWLEPILRGTGIDAAQVDYLPVFNGRNDPLHRYRGADLPPSSLEFARRTLAELRAATDRPVLLVHPLSCNSVPLLEHWSHWQRATKHLVESGYHVVLTGVDGPRETGEHATNLIGQTASMSDVFALALHCDGIVTTSNSLSMWAVIANRPSVVCCNRLMSDKAYYFRRWIETEPVQIVEFAEGMEEFKAAIARQRGRWEALSKAALSPRLRPGEPLTIRSLNGLGDIAWLAVALGHAKEQLGIPSITLRLHLLGDHRDGRAVEFARRLRAFDHVEEESFPLHLGPAGIGGRSVYRPNGYDADGPCTLIANPWIEHEGRLEDWLPGLKPDWRAMLEGYRRETADVERADELLGGRQSGFLCLHLGARKDNTDGGMNRDTLWSLSDWLELIKRIRTATDRPIYFLGASYDADYVAELLGTARGVRDLINLTSQTSAPVLVEILRRADAVVGFPSGVPILSTYLGTPTCMFWAPPYHSICAVSDFRFSRDFSTNWVPPDVLQAGTYFPAWFGETTPGEIAGWLTSQFKGSA
jgi:ADP-heptose:LPS heptosyltransferase